jgi:hypothetical protein
MHHVNQIQGDYIFFEWKEHAWKQFRKKEHELRLQGFRKVDQEFGFQDLYITYKHKDRRVMVTMALM